MRINKNLVEEAIDILDEVKLLFADEDEDDLDDDIHLNITDEERQGFTNLLAHGFTDTFRHLNGDVLNAYTWWAQRSRTSKINNTGWRIDYWLVSDRVADKVTKSYMIDSGARQDHTPIVMEINV